MVCFELVNGVMAKIKTDCFASQFLVIPITTGCFFPMAQKFAVTTSAMPCLLEIFGKSLFVKNFKTMTAYSPCRFSVGRYTGRGIGAFQDQCKQTMIN